MTTFCHPDENQDLVIKCHREDFPPSVRNDSSFSLLHEAHMSFRQVAHEEKSHAPLASSLTNATRLHKMLIMQKRGHRQTKARREILHIFEKAPTPLSATDVRATLARKGISAHKTTIYREIQYLIDQLTLKQVHISGSHGLYELADRPHHHHIICNSCGTIEELATPHEENFFRSILQNTSFEIDDHSLEFYGACADCQ